MKSIGKKTGIIWMILALVVTLLPLPSPVQAESPQYFHFDKFSTDPHHPTSVNTNVIELEGTFSGIAASSITYKIEKLINMVPQEGSRSGVGVAPIIEHGSTFRFYNVELFEGLNQITVSGVNAAGNTVSEKIYVDFSSSPAIYDIQLVDGRKLEDGQPVIVDTQTVTIMLKAPNATDVTIHGEPAVSGGSELFVATGIRLNPGLNHINIVAASSTMTYSQNRQLVYVAPGIPTAFNTKVFNSQANVGKTTTLLDGFPTVGQNTASGLVGKVQGSIIYVYDNQVDSSYRPPIKLHLYDGSGNPLLADPLDTTVGNPVVQGRYIIFPYESVGNLSIATNGKYRLEVQGAYGSQNAAYPIEFNYRDENSPYITDVRQAYNVKVENNRVTYTSSTLFSGGHNLFELPIWLIVKANNFNASDSANYSAEMKSLQNGLEATGFTYEKYVTADGDLAFKIVNMPANEQTLEISVSKGTNSDKKSFLLTYIPAASIRLENIYNGQRFNDNGTYPGDDGDNNKFSSIKGKLLNFNLNPGSEDLKSIQIRINGRSVMLPENQLEKDADGKYTGRFTYVPTNDMKLVPGANQIIITGVANNVAVSTSITVYMFSSNLPSITSMIPVPYDALTPRIDDPLGKFLLTGINAYTTNERDADILFSVQDVDKVVVNVDGLQLVTAEKDPDTGQLVPDNITGVETLLQIESYDAVTRSYDLRLRNLPLPQVGSTNIAVTVTLGSATVSETLQITRELLPYTILSPKLPAERVINQNFVMVSIKAEGADAVYIGKEPMVKGEQDIFRSEVKDLKTGINKINFTVVRGTEELKGSFEVNYAKQNIVGAQFKTTIPKSGRIRLFDNQLELNLPKGTMLRQVKPAPGTTEQAIDLFDSQQLLFGIADRQDGRTVKRYNKVGEKDTSTGDYLDGELGEFYPNPFASNMLASPMNFGFASNLYWLDAGYFDGSALGDYKTVDGQHPYTPGNEFYFRSVNSYNVKMLEPTQRGTITIQYDPSIRDAGADNLGIWRLVGNSGWQPIGGIVDKKKNTVTAPFEGFGFYAVFSLRYTFSDIAGHSYARDHLNIILSRGIMRQKNNGEFGVYDNITRGEFATMLVKMMDLPLNYNPNNMTFDDVPNVHIPDTLWDYRYIETAVRYGIVHGRAPKLFIPNGFITREEAAVMIARATNAKLGEPDKELPKLQKQFTDANEVNYYAIPSVQAITKDGLITGIPNQLLEGQSKQTYYFAPKAFLNRADAAIIAKRVLEKQKRL